MKKKTSYRYYILAGYSNTDSIFRTDGKKVDMMRNGAGEKKPFVWFKVHLEPEGLNLRLVFKEITIGKVKDIMSSWKRVHEYMIGF